MEDDSVKVILRISPHSRDSVIRLVNDNRIDLMQG